MPYIWKGTARKTGISLEAISDRTKISTSYLRAIESEEFDKLPGGVFNTNYIRQYASAIGFSEKRLLEVYKIKTTPEPAARNRSTRIFPNPADESGYFWRSVASPRGSTIHVRSSRSSRGH